MSNTFSNTVLGPFATTNHQIKKKNSTMTKMGADDQTLKKVALSIISIRSTVRHQCINLLPWSLSIKYGFFFFESGKMGTIYR